jgi:hypothetical protein
MADFDAALEVRHKRVVVGEVMGVDGRQQGDDHHDDEDAESGHRRSVATQLLQ